jgi:hypothetical protein
MASYNEAIEDRRVPDGNRFRSLVTLYKASVDYRSLAASTKRIWTPWLDRIASYFGDLRIAQFDRPEKIRPVIRKWRNGYADKPRTADYGLQVLSRVLSYGVDPLGKLASNPCEGIKRLYTGDRSEIIWLEADIALLEKTCPVEIAHAVDLAATSAPAPRRSHSRVLVACRRAGDRTCDRQEPWATRGDYPALRRAQGRPGAHSKALDGDPHQ